PPSPIVIKSLVTTALVTRIARHFGAQVVDNLLVGFKYVADVLWQLEQAGAYEDVQGTPEDFVFGCEESHGVLVTPAIRDKDAGHPRQGRRRRSPAAGGVGAGAEAAGPHGSGLPGDAVPAVRLPPQRAGAAGDDRHRGQAEHGPDAGSAAGRAADGGRRPGGD